MKLAPSHRLPSWLTLLMVAALGAGCAVNDAASPRASGLRGGDGVVASVLRGTTAAKHQLRELRVNPRDVRDDEILESLSGRSLYLDAVLDSVATPDQYLVCVDRLTGKQVTAVLKVYREVFKRRFVDPSTGEPLFDIITGKPLHADCAREIRADLASALRRFRDGRQHAVVDAVEFRRYVDAAPEERVARERLDDLDRFLTQLRLLGLSAKEEEHSRRAVLGRVCPSGLGVTELERLIARANADEKVRDAAAQRLARR